MSEIVNLRKARKAKERAARDAQAAENRARFGRTKAERELAAAKESLAARNAEAHRLDRDETP